MARSKRQKAFQAASKELKAQGKKRNWTGKGLFDVVPKKNNRDEYEDNHRLRFESPEMDSDWDLNSLANKQRREHLRLVEFEHTHHDFRPRGRKKLW